MNAAIIIATLTSLLPALPALAQSLNQMGIQRLSNDLVAVRFTGDSNRWYATLASGDLSASNWAVLSVRLAGTKGSIESVDSISNAPARFYRTRQVSPPAIPSGQFLMTPEDTPLIFSVPVTDPDLPEDQVTMYFIPPVCLAGDCPMRAYQVLDDNVTRGNG